MKKLGIILATGLAFTSCQHFEQSIGENAKNIEKNAKDIKSSSSAAKKDRDALYVKVFDVEKSLDKKIGKNTKSINGMKGDIATLYKSAVKLEERGAGSSSGDYNKIKKELDKARRERQALRKEIHSVVSGKKHSDHSGHEMSKADIDRLKKIEKDLAKAQKELEELRILLSHNKKSAAVIDQKLLNGGQSYDEVSKLKAAQKMAKAERADILKKLRQLDNELAEQKLAKDDILKEQAKNTQSRISFKSDVASLKKKLLS